MASSILFVFSLILFDLLGALTSTDKCTTPSCNPYATFSISFPFLLPQYQLDFRCEYSSDFTLSCSTDKKTLLRLPKSSGNFAIETIDYSKQKVTLTDPNVCFPSRFLEFRLSDSPFSSPYTLKISRITTMHKKGS
ncbi:hypothetical protein QQ045_015824 [Rhodiola kirilowii]